MCPVDERHDVILHAELKTFTQITFFQGMFRIGETKSSSLPLKPKANLNIIVCIQS